MNAERQALIDLVHAIDRQWEGESPKRRANALGPAIEDALSKARFLVTADLPETQNQRLQRELAALRASSNGS